MVLMLFVFLVQLQVRMERLLTEPLDRMCGLVTKMYSQMMESTNLRAGANKGNAVLAPKSKSNHIADQTNLSFGQDNNSLADAIKLVERLWSSEQNKARRVS